MDYTSPPPVPYQPEHVQKNADLIVPPDDIAGMEFEAFEDGFEAVIPIGNYFKGAVFLVGTTLVGFGGLMYWGYVATLLPILALVFGGRAALRNLLGTLKIKVRNGKVEIREGFLDFGLKYSADANELRSVILSENKPAWQREKSKTVEEIVLRTTKNEVRFGRRIGKAKRKFLYDVLIQHLNKVIRRVMGS